MKSSWKPFLIRLSVFLILIYILIPAIFYEIGIKPQIKVNMLLMPLAILGTILAFIIFKRKELTVFRYTFSWKQMFIFAILGYTQLVLYIFQQNTWIGYVRNLQFLFLGGFYFFAGSLFLFLAIFQLAFFKHFFKHVLTSFLLVFLYIITSFFLLIDLAPFLLKPLTKIVAWLLSLTNEVHATYSTQWPLLEVNGFSASIAPACTGVTSLVLFTGLFLYILLLDWQKIRKRAAVCIYVLGALGMALVAILRTYLIFLIGANVSQKFALASFHTNVSWVLFVAYFLVYSWFTYPLLLKNHQKTNRKL